MFMKIITKYAQYCDGGTKLLPWEIRSIEGGKKHKEGKKNGSPARKGWEGETSMKERTQ